nr:MAG TPA: hypothetical protein [Caudoviricetes sp.]
MYTVMVRMQYMHCIGQDDEENPLNWTLIRPKDWGI